MNSVKNYEKAMNKFEKKMNKKPSKNRLGLVLTFFFFGGYLLGSFFPISDFVPKINIDIEITPPPFTQR